MFNYQINRCTQVGYQLMLLMLLILITWQALSPQPIEQTQNINDKLGHVLAFFVLAFTTDHAYATSPFRLKKFLYLITYGILIEIFQHFIPNREFSVLDMLADAGGLLVYMLLWSTLINRELTETNTSSNGTHSKPG